METLYYHAKNKKEAFERAKKDLNYPFEIKLYKWMSKGNSMYQVIKKHLVHYDKDQLMDTESGLLYHKKTYKIIGQENY